MANVSRDVLGLALRTFHSSFLSDVPRLLHLIDGKTEIQKGEGTGPRPQGAAERLPFEPPGSRAWGLCPFLVAPLLESPEELQNCGAQGWFQTQPGHPRT